MNDQLALSTRRIDRRAAASVGFCLAVGNALVYVLFIVASRTLGPEEYGAFGALAALAVVASVPALAVQAVVARQVVVHGGTAAAASAVKPSLLRLSHAVGLGCLAATVAVTPVFRHYVHLESAWPLFWLAIWLWPLTAVSAYLGLLQGSERFLGFGGLFLLLSSGRAVGGAAAALVGLGLSGIMAGGAVGALGCVAVGAALARSRRPSRRESGVKPVREVATSAHSLLALIVLANVDVVLARHYLPARQAGIYAIGATVAKAVFWLPQFATALAYPRLAEPAGRARALRVAVVTVAAIGLVAVVATTLLARRVLRLAYGDAYGSVSGYAWVFAATGAALAMVQLLVYDRLAVAGPRLIPLIWTAVLVEVVAVSAFHSSALEIIVVALMVCAVLASAALLGQGCVRAGSGTDRSRLGSQTHARWRPPDA